MYLRQLLLNLSVVQDAKSIRKVVISEALESYVSLTRVLDTMTLSEVLSALSLESQSVRRKAIMCRLMRRAVRLNEIEFKAKLIREYFDGKTTLCGDG